jgi:predicted metal-dependent hydrolase
MPETGRVTDDPRFREGVRLFDAQDFFEAHEEWESLWHETRGAPRDFVQGLIQVTSAMHHLRNGNMRGARLLHDSGAGLLAPYGDSYEGVDLKSLRERFDASLKEILAEPLEKLPGRGHPGTVLIPFTPGRVFKFPFNPAS